MAKLPDLLGEFRPGAKFLGPGVYMRMQPFERIAGEREPVLVDEPGDVEHAYIYTHQVRLLRQCLVEYVELGAEFLRRRARAFIGEAFLGRSLPKLDLDLLLAIGQALHRAGAIGDIAFERGRGFWRSGRREYEAKAERPQIEMQIVFMFEQRRNLVLVAGRNQLWRGKFLFQILDDVVALDMHGAVIDQHRHQLARIDAKKPRLHVFVGHEIDRMRLPRNVLEIEKDAQFLRTRRAHEMEHVHAFPAEHFASLDVAVDELNHKNASSSGIFRAS